MSLTFPSKITNPEMRFDSFSNGKVLPGKKTGRLPAMGWNSWNAFCSGNTEVLTKAMADCIVKLGLDKLGYKYVVLDDGCYKSERVNGKLCNEPVKFPSGFKALSDYIHGKGLKFGMYNDIGTNLCAGAAVGTCGHEETDSASYVDWGVDFLKVDNCYYLWDNATFSNAENARFVFAPKIKGIKIRGTGNAGDFEKTISASQGVITGSCAKLDDNKEYVFGIGTFDGTNTGTSPVGVRSSELHFEIEVPAAGEYELSVEYSTSKENWQGEWLQIAVDQEYFYDDLLEPSKDKESFAWSKAIVVKLAAGKNTIRLMNHRRQENTLDSYAAMFAGLKKAKPDNDIVLSLCEWGKTHPQNWGYKVGDSWRILNDITFQVGSDGDAGHAAWEGAYTTSVTAQYNKAVIMDEFAGLGRGWNDPDMLMVGMDGLTETMCRSHFALWCMLNAPLFLGMDLRKVEKDDWIYNIISNERLIALNQDALGVQAKRIFTTKAVAPDTTYIRDNDRIDVLAKPLADGSVALAIANVSLGERGDDIEVGMGLVKEYIGNKFGDEEFKDNISGSGKLFNSSKFEVTDLWTGETKNVQGDVIRLRDFHEAPLAACECVILKVKSVD